jgi:hypothetical protein
MIVDNHIDIAGGTLDEATREQRRSTDDHEVKLDPALASC